MARLNVISCFRNLILAGFFAFLLLPCLHAQNSETDGPNQSVREEIHRYLGYEAVPIRYLTLPYDINMNSNVEGNFADIGFMLLAFLFIVILIWYGGRPKVLIPFLLLWLSFFLFSLSNGYLFDDVMGKFGPSDPTFQDWMAALQFSQRPLDFLVGHMYLFAEICMRPINDLISRISGDTSRFTYLMLGILFSLSAILLPKNRRKEKSRNVFLQLIAIFSLFGILFMLLSSGIIWYGYILVSLGWLILAYTFSRSWEKNRMMPIFKNLYMGIGVGVLLLFWMYRLAGINYRTDMTNLVVDPPVIRYSSGVYTKDLVYDSYFHKISSVIDDMNRDPNALVYRAGTFLTFFIENNHKRVFEDNQLGLFDQLQSKYPDKGTLAEVMKASGFQYLAIGLSLGAIDETPEQSLRQKVRKLMKFCNQNPNLELLVTDREVEGVGGQKGRTQNAVFGKVVKPGTFALYKIK